MGIKAFKRSNDFLTELIQSANCELRITKYELRSTNCKTTELCLQTSFLRKYQVPKEYQSNDNEIYVHSELSLSKELVKKVYKTFVENNPAYNLLYVPQAI